MPYRFQHFIAGEGTRKSRLHTQRGDRVAVSKALRALSQRALNNLPKSPWMAPSAVSFLDANLRPEWQLLELGSGASTVWFAHRVASVKSVEDDLNWAESLKQEIALSPQNNIDIIEDSPRSAVSLTEGFDVAIIDHLDRPQWSRIDSLRALSPRPGLRMVVLDDSDRPEYREADAIMSSWDQKRFPDIRPKPYVATETTVYLR